MDGAVHRVPRSHRISPRAAVGAAILVATVGLLFFVGRRRVHPPPPLDLSLWYWHRPFSIPRAEADQLRQMGVRRLFVRAGIFRKTPDGIRLTLPQEWRSPAKDFEVHLVFNFGSDVVQMLGKSPAVELSRAIWETADGERKRAEQDGARVGGIQLDLDSPTSKLSTYAALLATVHEKAKQAHLAFSITALPTWFSSGALRDVVSHTDFFVPQFYEAETPKTRQSLVGISNLARFERGMRAAGRLGVPFYAGIPAYGHALAFDEKDRLLGAYHDMAPDEALRSPGFRLIRAYGLDSRGQPAEASTYSGEDVADFEAPPMEGDRPFRLVYCMPSPAMVAAHLKILRAKRPGNCLGCILFRYPERGERETLPLEGLAAVVANRTAEPVLKTTVQVSSAPWELIETERKSERPPLELRVKATNSGASTTFFSGDSVTLTLVLDRPGIEEMPPPTRNYHSVDCYYADRPESVDKDEAGRLPRCSPARANVLVFHRACMGPGETMATGPIRLRADSATSVRGFWSVHCPGGFRTLSGKIDDTPLTATAVARQSDHETLGGDAARHPTNPSVR